MHLEDHLENLFRTRPKESAKATVVFLKALLPEKLLFLADLMLRDDTIRALPKAPRVVRSAKDASKKPKKQRRATRLDAAPFLTLMNNVRAQLRIAGKDGLHIRELIAKSGADIRHVRRALITLRRDDEAETKGMSKGARWVLVTKR
jgi:hypothetical protein